MERQAYYSQPALRRPSVTKILYDLKARELANPIFVCLHCTAESQTQHAMAAHCRLHVRAGMAKGTVDHVKYYPDHTYTFLCNNPPPNRHPPLSADQAMPPQPSNQIYPEPAYRYNPILPYSGSITMSDLARFPWLQLDGPHQYLMNITKMQRPTLASMQRRPPALVVSSSSSPFGAVVTGNHNEGGSRTNIPVPPVIDLTLRLGPTPSSFSENSLQGTTFPF